jgi:hypothetical protein
MKKRTDIYNQVWNLPLKELCPTCGQPDNDGTCNHKKLKNKDVIALNGTLPEKPVNYNIKIHHSSFGHDRQDCFWYCNKQIATVKVPDGVYSLECCGDIKVSFSEDSDYYKNENAVKEAFSLDLTDKKINKLYQGDNFYMNNWFEVVFIDNDNNTHDIIGDVSYDYPEAIEQLKTYAEEKIYIND